MIDLLSLEAGSPRLSLLLGALEALERGDPFAGGVQLPEGLTRLADAWVKALSETGAETPEAELRWLVTLSPLLNSLFAAARKLDDEAQLIPLNRLSGADQGRRSALLTLDGGWGDNLDQLHSLPPEFALLKTLSLVATAPVLTRRGAERRETLLVAADRLADCELPATLGALALFAAAWMNCSYADLPGKHRIKAVLNRLARRLLTRLGLHDVAPPPGPRALSGRPTMVIIAEHAHSQHVQFRYFGQYLRQLRTRFHLVLVAPRPQIEPAVADLVDETFAFDVDVNGRFLSEVARFVRQASPDVVFWPSVGMAKWGPLLANLRLAPIQMTALGHSASTFIPVMDYYLTEAGYVSDADLFSERVLLLPDQSLRFERPPAYEPIAPEIRRTADDLRVAVPSSALKLNPGFLEMLASIRAQASRPVQFHIFPNTPPLHVAALRAVWGEALGQPIVYPRMRAQNYLSAVNACDLILSPYPFGGLHSVVDGLRQGLPVVAMEGAEPHSRTDAMILRRLGLPDWLIARTTDEYRAAALRVIDDDAMRVALSEQALAMDVDATLFGDASTPLGDDVVEMVWAAYRRHEAIQREPRRGWSLQDVLSLQPEVAG